MTELLSICVGHYKRSAVPHAGSLLPIFPRCVQSLCPALAAVHQTAELVVATSTAAAGPNGVDLRSHGEPPTIDAATEPAAWLLAVATIPVRVIECPRPFSRGRARNLAANASQGDWLMFLDADMIVPPELIRRGCELLRAGKAFFPMYRRFIDPDHDEWSWGTGTGNSFVLREHYLAAGGFPAPESWGGEDTTFWDWFKVHRLSVRERVPTFCHQWHPPSKGPIDGN